LNEPWPTPANLAPDDIEAILERTVLDRLPIDNDNDDETPEYDNESGWGLLNARRALQFVERPQNLLLHLPDASTSRSLSSSLFAEDVEWNLLEDAYGLKKDRYRGDVYERVITYDHTTSIPTGYSQTDLWTRNSSALGFPAGNLSVLPGYEACHIVSQSGNTVTLRTFEYWIKEKKVIGWVPVNPWVPVPVTSGNLLCPYTIMVYNPNATDVDEPNEKESILVVTPNPAGSQAMVHWWTQENGPYELRIHSADGRFTWSQVVQSTGTLSIPSSNWQSGVYLISLLSNIDVTQLIFVRQ